MILLPVLVVSTTLLASSPTPQTPAVEAGMAAYHSGDFAAALAILKPIVYDVRPDYRTPPDLWATAYLAQMFRRGEGTAPDWPLSCALFNEVWPYTQQHGPQAVGSIPFVGDGIQEVCLPQLHSEMLELRQACYLDGVTRREFVFEGQSWLVADRRGFHLDGAGGQHRDVPLGMRCHEIVVSLTEADVSVPDRWSGSRVHFLELFKWTNRFDQSKGGIVRQLHWMVYGVRGTDFGLATDQIVLTVMGGAYPSLELPPGIRDAAVLQLNAAGRVEWSVDGPDGKRGVIPEMGRPEVPTSPDEVPGRAEEPAGDFAVRFDHKTCHYEYLDMFRGTYSAGGAGPVPFTLSKEQRSTLFKAIAAARILDLPASVDAADGYELEVRNGGKRLTVSWDQKNANRALSALTSVLLKMLNPTPGDGCAGGPPKVR